jgi:hypothetical protein
MFCLMALWFVVFEFVYLATHYYPPLSRSGIRIHFRGHLKLPLYIIFFSLPILNSYVFSFCFFFFLPLATSSIVGPTKAGMGPFVSSVP